MKYFFTHFFIFLFSVKFISAQQAYVNGLVGLFWFCLGNFLTLGAFAYFAKRIRNNEPKGFTFSGYLRERFSGRVQSLFVVEMMILATCAFAINLLAGSKTVETLTGVDYTLATFLMAGVAILYSFRTGLKATVVTEIFVTVSIASVLTKDDAPLAAVLLVIT